MKTLMLYESFLESARFYLLDGDYSRFDKIYINDSGCDEALCDELSNFMFDDVLIEENHKPIQFGPDVKFDIFVQCGILP